MTGDTSPRVADDRPTQEPSLARSWIKITNGQDDARRRRPASTRVLVGVGAVLVLAVMLGIGAVLRVNCPPAVDDGFASPGAELVLGESIPVDRAWAEIKAKAEVAQPTVVPDRAVVYVRSDGASLVGPSGGWHAEPETHRMWLDPLGMYPLMIVRNGRTMMDDGVRTDLSDAWQVAQRQDRADIVHPTPQWLANLPTDPVVLEALLIGESESMRGDWSQRHGRREAVRES